MRYVIKNYLDTQLSILLMCIGATGYNFKGGGTNILLFKKFQQWIIMFLNFLRNFCPENLHLLNFNCPLQNIYFLSVYFLAIHTDTPIMYCNFCPKLFTSGQGIRKHCDCKHKLPEGIKIGPQKSIIWRRRCHF